MPRRGMLLYIVSASLVVCACTATVPPSRITEYVSVPREGTREPLSAPGQGPLEAGLVLISDTLAPDAAPNLPEEALARLGEQLRQEISRVLPVSIKEVIPADEIRPADGTSAQFATLAQRHGLEYLAVVVVSSTEQEYPMALFLGWTAYMQPGYRRDNWSLIEFALLDVKEGDVLMQAEGRGWATLDRPAAPGINQWYPVVYLRPQDPERRFWPPTYEGAPNTLRVVSFNEAAKRLTANLQQGWSRRLNEDAVSRRQS